MTPLSDNEDHPVRRFPRLPLLAVTLPGLLAMALTVPAPSRPEPRLAPVATVSSTKVADLRRRVTTAINSGTATWLSGAVDVDGVGSLYRNHSTTAVPPASTQKLLTTFAAIQRLGAGTRLRTDLRAAQPQVGSIQPGDLYLVAGGDPYLTSAQLDAMAASVRSLGIRSVSGALVLDDHRYDAVRRVTGWKTSFVPEESGPLSAMALDKNAWRSDSGYLADPGLPALSRLRSMLQHHGVAVGALRRGSVPQSARVLVRHQSSPVSTLVRLIDKDSDNFAAELLLKELGRVDRAAGTSAAGAATVRSVLQPLGVTVGLTYDGSGLSSKDRQTAAGELQLLAAAQRSTGYAALRAALPVACVDGTLETRMCKTAAAGRAAAKTGTLPGVRALAGWTTTADGHRVRFAFVLANYSDATRARNALDAAVVTLAGARVEA